MTKLVHKAGISIALAFIALAASPVVFLALAKAAWEWIELRAVYSGDTEARDRDRWRAY